MTTPRVACSGFRIAISFPPTQGHLGAVVGDSSRGLDGESLEINRLSHDREGELVFPGLGASFLFQT